MLPPPVPSPRITNLAAARALTEYEDEPETICRKAMGIAADVCVFTNGNLTIETIEEPKPE